MRKTRYPNRCDCAMLAAGGPRQGRNRVLRGGSWINNGRNLRAAYRNHNAPDNRNHNIGLRLAGAFSTGPDKAGGSGNQRSVRFRSGLLGRGGQTPGPRRGSRPSAETLPPGRLFLRPSPDPGPAPPRGAHAA